MNTNGKRTAAVEEFSRNNYFYGKLLTVEDMDVEQAYHTHVQRTVNRFISDWGVICGLEVSAEPVSVDDADRQELAITVSEGLALDRCGRLIAVEDDVHDRVPIPVIADGDVTDTVSVYVEYDECYADPVPAAKMENACEQECKDNRIVQGAKVTVEPGPPGDYHKSIANIEFPDVSGLHPGEQTLGVRGDFEVFEHPQEGEPGTVDLTVADTAPDGDVVVDIGFSETDERMLVSGSLRVPSDTLIRSEGFTVPEDETFDVTGTYSQGPFHLTVDGSLTAVGDEGHARLHGELRFQGADPDEETSIPFDFEIDIHDGALEIDGEVDAEELGLPPAPVMVNGELSIHDEDDAYRVAGEASVSQVRDGERHTLANIEHAPWEDEDGDEVHGILVDKPRERVDDGTSEFDAVLAEIARSYRENEPRTDCGNLDDEPILVGVVTRQDEDWESTDVEPGPLLYDNDMLYDVFANHVAGLDNPHQVQLGVRHGTGPGVDAHVGIEEQEGLTGSIGLTSTNDSVSITPNQVHGTVDLAAATWTIEELSNPGGNVDVDSPTGTIAVDTGVDNATGDPQLQLDLATDVRRTLDALERYVMDKALKCTQAEFDAVADRFDSDRFDHARQIANRAMTEIEEMFESGELTTDTFLTLIEGTDARQGLYELQRQLQVQLKHAVEDDHLTKESYDRYKNAMSHLADVLDRDSLNAAEVAVAQDLVCEAAERLEAEVVIEERTPFVVTKGETQNISRVPLSGGGVIGREELELRGISGEAEGRVEQIDDPRAADFSGFVRGGYDADDDDEADIVVKPSQRDLTEIEGIASATRDRLHEAGIRTVSDLALADPELAVEIEGLSENQLNNFINRSRDWIIDF